VPLPTDLHRDRGRNLLALSSVRQEMDRGQLDHLPARRCPRKGLFLQPSRRGMQRASESLVRSAFRRAETYWLCPAESMRSGGVWYERTNEEETPTKENAGSGPPAQERGELLKAIRSLNKNVVRLMDTIREVGGWSSSLTRSLDWIGELWRCRYYGFVH
jgi:hypothetical protein